MGFLGSQLFFLHSAAEMFFEISCHDIIFFLQKQYIFKAQSAKGTSINLKGRWGVWFFEEKMLFSNLIEKHISVSAMGIQIFC